MTDKQRFGTLEGLERRVVECRKCPRLVRYREQVAQTRRRAFRDATYWGRPSPGFGDPAANLLIVGLAPAAHGGNRTGRMFTGDRSGDFLYECLYQAGFASQPSSTQRDDGLRLSNLFITAVCRCAPPANKPLPAEIARCRPYLAGEFDLIRPRAVLALGGIALRGLLAMLKEQGRIASFAPYPFRHGANYRLPGDLPRLFTSYHPSQQNTFTGRLTRPMFLSVLRRIARHLEGLEGKDERGSGR
ncbi:MAG TPA: uracil-DNA glycosylase [Patescibacteria group bacterium]|nr:uracil-DNA glycosylase [Patescibacteria group bacterium]